MKPFRWVPGRQAECEYKKMRLWQFGSETLNKFSDCYLIKYPPNAILPIHKDPVGKGEHWRLNIEIKGDGVFICKGKCYRFWRFCLFRPDVNDHGMVNGSTERLVLSLGFVK